MIPQNTYPLLRDSLEFTADVLKYSEILEKEQKKPIAMRLMQSGINLNTYLYQAQTAVRDDDKKFKLQKAKTSIEEVLYWLKQCTKSNYINDDARLFRIGYRLSDDINVKLND